ncbi:thiopeptide-type bacteriocin biosynthesis protein [Streptomyces roseoverticillatus]|uniref:thiopeptide-type bacteriocin biosynthesis protein n=1 Tax=Streptomyces roseoverticillatus TaxID=66429 RepID=UPI0033DDE113
MNENKSGVALAEDWVYYRIYMRSREDLEGFLGKHLQPLIRRLKMVVPDTRWFFLNYVDAFGTHVRLRVRAPSSELGAVEQAIDETLSSTTTVRDTQKALYAPETWKFGNGAAMEAAEEVFWRSSEAALICIGSHKGNLRIVHGATHTHLMAALLPRPLRIAFLHQYAWYWSGGPLGVESPASWRQDTAARTGRMTKAETMLDRITATVRTTAGQSLAHYAEHVSSLLKPPYPHPLALSHHVHLTNNRLGLTKGEEAQIARLLWLAERLAAE